MRTDSFGLILWMIILAGGVYLTIRYLWPLLLVIATVIAIGWFRLRSLSAKARQEAERMEEELRQTDSSYQNDLFYEQAARKMEEPGEIVDVEFTRKDEPDREEGRL